MSARTIATAALLAVVLNTASVSALPCGRGAGLRASRQAPSQEAREFDLASREPEPLWRDRILPAAGAGASRVWNGVKNQGHKIMADPGKYVDRVGTIAQGASTVIGAISGRPVYRDLEDSLELREDELAELEEMLAREPLWRDKILPAAGGAASRVWNGAKNQGRKVMADPGKYLDRVTTVAQGASTVVGAFGGRQQALAYRDLEYLLELREDELAELEEMLAREPLWRDKILPAAGEAASRVWNGAKTQGRKVMADPDVSRVWNGAKNQGRKIMADPGKYVDRVSTTVAQGASTVLGAFRGRPAAPASREFEQSLLELRNEELADVTDARAWEIMDEMD